jgi:hypothetical protein
MPRSNFTGSAVIKKISFVLMALITSETALSENSVVLGRGTSNSHVEGRGCVDDLGMNCWYLWELLANATVAGPRVKGHIRALTLQHTDATSKFVKSVELFILAPLGSPDPTGATYSILALSPKYPDGKYCVWLDPLELGIPIDKSEVSRDSHGAYCFSSLLLKARR